MAIIWKLIHIPRHPLPGSPHPLLRYLLFNPAEPISPFSVLALKYLKPHVSFFRKSITTLILAPRLSKTTPLDRLYARQVIF
jgi:hypothetical protein